MVKNFPFLQRALSHPFHFYFSTLSKIAPIHLVALLIPPILVLRSLFVLTTKQKKNQNQNQNQDQDQNVTGILINQETIHILTLWIWPVSFLLGLTIVGVSGGGYQSRFMLPILPATSILSGYYLTSNKKIAPACMVLLHVGVLHFMFYGVLYYPMFSEFEYNIFDIIWCILSSPQYFPASQENYQQILKFMSHYGLNRTV